MMTTILRNARILKGTGLVQTDILLEGERISKIGSFSAKADKVINLDGFIVMPGLIDPHVHLREPGLEHKEGFATGGRAAAAGGYTTIVDMPNTKPPTVTIEALHEKIALSKKSIVNVEFYFGINKSTSDIFVPKEVVGVKVFLNESTGSMLISDKKVLEKVFSSFKHVAVHAEDEMVEFACKLTQKCKNRLYLCHISKKSELKAAIKYKHLIDVFVEVTPHHLFLNESNAVSPLFLMKPPLRQEEDRKALWNAISEGLVDTIGTDHAPHTLEEKNSKTPAYGVPGLESALPLMLNQVHKGKVTLETVQKLMSENPARILGFTNKGKICEGNQADLTVVDLNREFLVQGDKLETKCKWSPFEGMKLRGCPVMTIVKGCVAHSKL